MLEKQVTLTPNKRLAKHLQRQLFLKNVKNNQITWLKTEILPIMTWLTDLWSRSSDPRVLLTPVQEKLIWQKIITEHLGEKFKSLADLAADFRELTNSYELEPNDFSQSELEQEEIKIFQNLYEKFKKYCKNKGVVTICELPTLLLPYIPEHDLENIIFAGFDEYNPQLQTFIENLEKIGCKISKFDPNKQQSSLIRRLGCDNLKQEITLAALWIKNITQQNPESSIGIIVQNLAKLRPKISRIFTEVLPTDTKINISVGTPLRSLPIINSALDLLALDVTFSLEKLRETITSPYIKNAEIEKPNRSILNSKLQQLAKSELTLSDIKYIANKHFKNLSLIEILQKWQNLFLKIQNQTLKSSEWAQNFARILKIFGWPGENNLTDEESLATNLFTKTLQEFAATDPILEKITYKKSLQTFNEFISQTLQPDPETDTNINIIGPLEAAGINFDYLWIMGLDQETWPPTPHPNPFIPFVVQKKLSLPHSSSERELHFCSTLINRYKRSAKEIIFSYVKYADDRIIEPSPLITDISETTIQKLKLTKSTSWVQKIYDNKKLEELIDNDAPQLKSNEIDHATSRLIELQSSCPFQAFMEFRLKTKEPIKKEFGISKIDRGILVHKLLEKIWQKIKTQQQLNSLDQNELQELIRSNVKDALDKLSLSKKLCDIENKHLTSLLNSWLEIEKTRPSFKVIATEKPIQIKLSSIPIKLRIDRIDQLADGKILLIDYKTGKNLPSIFDWFNDRPKKPQIPLYSLAVDSIKGLVLAQISSESIKFKEINLDNLAFGLRNANPYDVTKNITWNDLTKYWTNVLTKIVKDFAAGDASPDPISPNICKKCSFSSVCRVTY